MSGAGSVPRRSELSAGAEFELHDRPRRSRTSAGTTRWTRDSVSRGAGLEHRPRRAAEFAEHADGRSRDREPGNDALVERGGRAAAAAGLGRCRLRRQQDDQRAAADQRQPGAAHGRRRRGSAVFRLSWPAARRSTCISRTARRLSLTAGRRHAAVHARPAAEGALHLQPARCRSAPAPTTPCPHYELPTAEAQERNWALAGTRPHTATMSFVYQLPWRSDGTRSASLQAMSTTGRSTASSWRSAARRSPSPPTAPP